MFGLKLAILNHDVETLKVLWSVYMTWTAEHLEAIVLYCLRLNWPEGIQTLLTSDAADILISTVSIVQQCNIIEKWVTLEKKPEVKEEFESQMCLRFFALPALTVALAHPSSTIKQIETLSASF